MSHDQSQPEVPRAPSGRVPQWVLDEAARRERELHGPATITPDEWARSEERRRYTPPELQPYPDDDEPPLTAAPYGGARTDRRLSVLAMVLSALVVLAVIARMVLGHPGGLSGAFGDLLTGNGSPLLEREAPEQPGVQPDGTVVLADGSEYRLDEGPGAVEGVGTGEPGPRWSTCHAIPYVVDETDAPEGFEQEMHDAVAEVQTATGLSFVFEGVVDEPPGPRALRQPDRYGDRWAPLLVRWSDAEDVPGLEGSFAGLGTTHYATDPGTGTTFRVGGVIDLDVTLKTWPSQGGEPAYVATLRHELGHVLGLDHVDDPAELMHPKGGYGQTFADGDLAGLAVLGQGPCARW